MHKKIPYYPIKRLYYYSEKVAGNEVQYNAEPNADLVETTPEQANLVSSKLQQVGVTNKDWVLHAPVIDFDVPIEVYPSSQLGHHHLYINKPVSWKHYEALLKALSNAGLVEWGFTNASIAKGLSAVRPVGVIKHDAPRGVNVLIENAKLRRENYALKQQLDILLQQQAEKQNDNNNVEVHTGQV